MKKYYEMNHVELLEANLARKIPGGPQIDADTARANLVRLLPMAKDTLAKNFGILKDLSESALRTDSIWTEWKQDCDRLKKAIAEAEREVGKEEMK